MRVPGEICMEHLERGNYYRKVILNMQKSAEVVVAKGNIVPLEVKDQISRSPKYNRERRNG